VDCTAIATVPDIDCCVTTLTCTSLPSPTVECAFDPEPGEKTVAEVATKIEGSCSGDIEFVGDPTVQVEGDSCTTTKTRTYTVSAPGRGDTTVTETCDETWTVVDTTGPVISNVGDATFECPVDDGTNPPPVTDACGNFDGEATSTDGTLIGGCSANTGTKTRTWEATDTCGNSAIPVTQQITIQDTVAPVLTCSDSTNSLSNVGCDAMIPGASAGDCTATDACDGDVSVDFCCTFDATNGFTRTWTASDACGKEASTVQTITVDATCGTA